MPLPLRVRSEAPNAWSPEAQPLAGCIWRQTDTNLQRRTPIAHSMTLASSIGISEKILPTKRTKRRYYIALDIQVLA
jgi:hypothetical protein